MGAFRQKRSSRAGQHWTGSISAENEDASMLGDFAMCFCSPQKVANPDNQECLKISHPFLPG
jgi:hypothetical protein